MNQKLNLNKIKGIRAEKGLTQEQVAKIISVSSNTYISKENGKIDFKVEELTKIANSFEVPISIFFSN